MKNKIPDSFIDDLLARTDIVSIIDTHVPLKKAGREFKACCPFHDEKTPSFTVVPDKQFYHCFGCGAHGTAIGFLMDYERLGFVEAVTDLAIRAGISVPTVDISTPRETEEDKSNIKDIFETLTRANQFYRQQLKDHPSAPSAVNYLKGRGISGEIAAKFGIGFAPSGWNNLMNQFGADPKQTVLLDKAGLITRRDDQSFYDRFRDRITYPIRDTRGRVIGFGARSLSNENNPKYLNSPETAVFHKGNNLYGLYEARQANKSLPRAMVVEGYMDVIALHQYGINYAVATLGTATTPEHIKLLFRFTSEIVFCFDGDTAGKRAAKKAFETCLPHIREGREIKFMFLPEKEDPDTFVRKLGAEQFTAAIKSATPLSEFLVAEILAHTDIRTLEGRAKAIDDARTTIANIAPGIFKNMLVHQLSQKLQLNEHETEHLSGEQAVSETHATAARKNAVPTGRKQAPSLIQMAITLIFQQPSLARLAAPEELHSVDLPGIAVLQKLLEIFRKEPNLPLGSVIERFRDDIDIRYLARLVATASSNTVGEHIDEEFLDTIQRIKKTQNQAELTQLLERSKQQSLSIEEKRRLAELLSRN